MNYFLTGSYLYAWVPIGGAILEALEPLRRWGPLAEVAQQGLAFEDSILLSNALIPGLQGYEKSLSHTLVSVTLLPLHTLADTMD